MSASPLDRLELAATVCEEGAEYLFRLRVYRDHRVLHTTTALHRGTLDGDAATSRRGSADANGAAFLGNWGQLHSSRSSMSMDLGTAL